MTHLFTKSMKKFNVKIILVIILLTLQVCLDIKGQTSSPKYGYEAVTCEEHNLYIDMLNNEAKNNKERIFIISSLNKKEKYGLNINRLNYMVAVLTQAKDIKPERIITAIGKRTSEKKGRLEVYLGSQFFLVITAESGKQVCLLCCNT